MMYQLARLVGRKVTTPSRIIIDSQTHIFLLLSKSIHGVIYCMYGHFYKTLLHSVYVCIYIYIICIYTVICVYNFPVYIVLEFSCVMLTELCPFMQILRYLQVLSPHSAPPETSQPRKVSGANRKKSRPSCSRAVYGPIGKGCDMGGDLGSAMSWVDRVITLVVAISTTITPLMSSRQRAWSRPHHAPD